MEVKLDKTYPLDVDMERAWQVLSEVPTVAGCMPGAAITEQVDATHYKGNVKVKVGPATAAFAGDIEVRALEPATRTLQLFGKGADRGGSSASMELTATIAAGADPQHAQLIGQANVIVNGKFAQFGGRMMVQVSDMLLAQFVENFRAEAAARPLPGPASPSAASAPADGAAPAAAAADGGTGATSAAAPVVALATPSAPLPGAPSGAVVPPRTAPQAGEINALAILWSLIKAWFAGLFGRRA